MRKRIVKEKYQHRINNLTETPFLRIFNETVIRVPRTAMQTIYTALLKKKFSLNVVCVGNVFSKKLHKECCGKNTPSNILTFPPNDAGVAEIYINIVMAAKTAKKHHISIKKQILFLYIHGILHLLGYRHGAQMETLEDRYITMYT